MVRRLRVPQAKTPEIHTGTPTARPLGYADCGQRHRKFVWYADCASFGQRHRKFIQVRRLRVLWAKTPEIHMVRLLRVPQAKTPEIRMVRQLCVPQAKTPEIHMVRRLRVLWAKTPEIRMVRRLRVPQAKTPEIHKVRRLRVLSNSAKTPEISRVCYQKHWGLVCVFRRKHRPRTNLRLLTQRHIDMFSSPEPATRPVQTYTFPRAVFLRLRASCAGPKSPWRCHAKAGTKPLASCTGILLLWL